MMKNLFLLRSQVLLLLVVSLVGMSGAALAQDSEEPFVFAVSAMASPATTFSHFSEFRDYLATKLQRPVVMKQRRTYAEINELLKNNDISMAFTCTGGFLDGRHSFGLEALAAPIVHGEARYQSFIIVSQDDPATSLLELQDRVFAFTDPLSLTGRLYPTAKVNAAGYSTADFFKKTFYTASHDKSIAAVANGIADGAAVDSLIYKALMNVPESIAHKVKVIEVSEYFGMPPIVVSPVLSKKEKLTLLKILLNMESDPDGKRVLKDLDYNGFTLSDPSMYHSALLLTKQITEE
ncbi:phosphonate transport system substrate-binding protein [Desulfuromusa kysingii]|uniref:Phosphonate transport system substrate-binding protein n=2 Tax=Desulfuromusa kysingii TaxID=37625 RepID=A0A1H4DXK7_9BACT|nr:phosphonate transport system substrate-binding protein [Desulfuromusa kysingii]